MRAVTIAEPGGPERMSVSEVPDPVPAADEVLVEIAASGVNRADILQRRGMFPPPRGGSPYLGLECSGRVIGVGPAVADWRVGDEVCAPLSGGGYAERVSIPARHLLPVPKGVSLVDAASLPEVACTAWLSLAAYARLRVGETLLVHGGASGVGTFAVQYGVAMGATVIVTARRAKHEAVLALGASSAIDYTRSDFVTQISDTTGGRGVDVILDIMGAEYLSRNVEALAEGGRLAIVGMQGGGHVASLNLAALLVKRASIAGISLRSRALSDKADIVDRVREHIWPLIGSGMIRPVVDRYLPMEQVSEAHRIIERSDHIGKIVLASAHEVSRQV